CGYEVGDFVHTFGDTHIYLNHLEQVKLQLSRAPMPLPKLKLNQRVKKIEDFKFEDIEILNYNSHPSIKGKISV
ncbi:MAG: thymidylate synthase, partial [Cryomorphaceae bacterium]|nr:thymidylate synthase [Cryomorphaceae bacterium]